ncbi:MAG: hypothetical protein OEV43_03050 [Coriobacteriia bacterium]|nr:hypothetical protein [Coriobacteriia bacterium]
MNETIAATETTTTAEAAAAVRGGGWSAQTAGEKAFSLVVFGFGVMVSAVFSYYLIADPGRLTEAWEWIRSLPLLAQVVLWLLFLPWMAALWVWNMPWALGIRLVLVVGTLVFTNYLLWPWKE